MLKLAEIIEMGHKLTPMMEQYYQTKKNYPEHLVFFRMGDFYELFFEDAHIASKALNITLTHRGKLADYPIPMAGIPHHAAGPYIERLTKQGMKIAVCEQIEDPKMAKGIVKRKVTQLVSPGMPYDLDRAEKNQQHYLASLSLKGPYYLALLDFTTGDFVGITTENEGDLIEYLQIYHPKELITYHGQWEQSSLINQVVEKFQILTSKILPDFFAESESSKFLNKLIPGFKNDRFLARHPGLISTLCGLSYYVCSTQAENKYGHIRPFQLKNNSNHLKISYSALKGLELYTNEVENRQFTLFNFIDKTQSALGSRTLKKNFLEPLRNPTKILERQEQIKWLLSNNNALLEMKENLQDVRDLERILAKASSNKTTAQDLLNFSLTTECYIKLTNILKESPLHTYFLSEDKIESLKNTKNKIVKAINSELGASLEKGNLIRPGFSKQRDKLSDLNANSVNKLELFEKKYRDATGISNLKVKSNNLNGIFIEISKSHLKKVPNNFVRRQTLVNSERFITSELAEFEKSLVHAKFKLEVIEKEIFADLVAEFTALTDVILLLANTLGHFDFIYSLAVTARNEGWSCPIIKIDDQVLKVKGAYHPMIKKNIQEQFVTHDLELNSNTFFGLITGPNMAGKTTVMREMAIIQFLMQVGSYVPAFSAELSIKDFIFSRLGAFDNIQKNQSTFMVEMSETAEIIRHATKNSLILVDEIGRGTSTYDGMSIAWALIEYFLQEIQAITLFSTHYHELTELISNYKTAKNLTVETKVSGDKISFLYRLIEGSSAQSFGLHVAALAGLPKSVILGAEKILTKLEKKSLQNQVKTTKNNDLDQLQKQLVQDLVPGSQLSFFPEDLVTKKVKEPNFKNPKIDHFLEKIKRMDFMNTTPVEAMNKLYELQKQLDLH